VISLRKWSGGSAHLHTFRGSIGCKKCVLLAAILLYHSCFFTQSINQGWANLLNRRAICRKPNKQRAAKRVCSVNINMVKNASFTLNDVQ